MRPRVLFGFGLLLGLAFAWTLGANALPLGSNESGSKEARCLNRCSSAQEAWRAIGPTGITMNPRRSRAVG
ncbi:hypothetical protein FJW08_30705 [Mesorhizobium sp. B3-2-1]|nr:hypothetical protein FJW08_30705 [Mesorhizobium sp. B3-2-1]